jgi:glycine cleavage system H protein
MAALLAVATFALFILVDYLLSRREEARATVPAPVPVGVAAPTETAPPPVWVAGYDLPEHLHYHRGHLWARVDSSDTATIGVDDFGRRLLGRVEGVVLPRVGDRLRQGARGAEVDLEGRAVGLVAPVDGEVVAVNQTLESEPERISEDPYGRGWLYRIRSSDLVASLRNLLNGTLARKWMEDAREQLEVRLMALSGSVLQDGGSPAPDFARHLELEDWQQLVRVFLLTEGTRR